MHALLWQNGTITNLGSLGGQGWNTPMAINQRGDIVGFSDLPGDVSGGVLTPNFHAFIWTKESGKMTDIGVLPGDTLSEALDINDQGQVVGVSFPSGHAFIYENNQIRDLNSLLPERFPRCFCYSPAVLTIAGEITGEACVIANGACTADQPAFLAIPDGGFSADASEEETNNEAANVTVPDSVHQRVMRKLAFGHFGSERARSQ